MGGSGHQYAEIHLQGEIIKRVNTFKSRIDVGGGGRTVFRTMRSHLECRVEEREESV